MKVIVFGGSGFLGSFVAEQLTQEGHAVTIFDLKPSVFLTAKQKMLVGDILDKEKVAEAIKGQDYVFNFAGIADIGYAYDHPYETLNVNIHGNLNILNACVAHKVKRYLFASTLYVYSKLGSYYRASKQACELTIEAYAERNDFKFTILRYGSLYGPRANKTNWLNRVLIQALDQKKITRHGDGEEIREYIHVLDAARLSTKAMGDEFENQYVIISGNQSIKIKDLMVMIKEMFGNTVELEFKESNEGSHYEITPYNFRPKLAKKIEDTSHIDLGQGLLDLIYTLADEKSDLDSELRQILKSRL
jgi:UDP-glucose 4-epimerase